MSTRKSAGRKVKTGHIGKKDRQAVLAALPWAKYRHRFLYSKDEVGRYEFLTLKSFHATLVKEGVDITWPEMSMCCSRNGAGHQAEYPYQGDWESRRFKMLLPRPRRAQIAGHMTQAQRFITRLERSHFAAEAWVEIIGLCRLAIRDIHAKYGGTPLLAVPDKPPKDKAAAKAEEWQRKRALAYAKAIQPYVRMMSVASDRIAAFQRDMAIMESAREMPFPVDVPKESAGGIVGVFEQNPWKQRMLEQVCKISEQFNIDMPEPLPLNRPIDVCGPDVRQESEELEPIER